MRRRFHTDKSPRERSGGQPTRAEISARSQAMIRSCHARASARASAEAAGGAKVSTYGRTTGSVPTGGREPPAVLQHTTLVPSRVMTSATRNVRVAGGPERPEPRGGRRGCAMAPGGREADNRILERALTVRADVIVTGDQHLLRLKRFQGILIASPREFLDTTTRRR